MGPYALGVTTTGGGRIYHLMPAAEWGVEWESGGAVAAPQLEGHGFVHCCTREQILEVATWWLAGDAPLVAVEIDAGRAGDVRFERADLGREYPHVYNAIPRDAVVGAHALAAAPDGLELPAALADPAPMFEVAGTLDGRAVRARWQGGALVDGDADVLERAALKIEKGEDVLQFPEVTRPASVATAYDAFCLLAATLDEVRSYRGDGFVTE